MPERLFRADVPDGIDTPNLDAVMAIRLPRIIAGAWRRLADQHVAASGKYTRALEDEDNFQYPYLGDPDATAVVNPTKEATFIEQGRAGFSLPKHWGNEGGVWKVGKDGRRYANVPFRHGTPISESGGSTTTRDAREMPQQIYRGRTARFWGKGGVPYTVTANGEVVDNSAALKLERGDRLMGFGDYYRLSRSYDLYRSPGFFSEQGIDAPAEDLDELPQGYTWTTSKYEGLTFVGSHTTPGGGSQGEYMTWRTISEDSDGWYIPPMRALHLAERALEMIAPDVEKLIAEAVAKDMSLALVGATEGL